MKNFVFASFISLNLFTGAAFSAQTGASIRDPELRARCLDLLEGYIYLNKEQSLSAIEELRGLLPELERRGISHADRIEVLQKILVHYGQYASEQTDRFHWIDEILTALGKTDDKTFQSYAAIQDADRYGVLESDGFDFIVSKTITAQGARSWGDPLIASDRVLVLTQPEYLAQIARLMEQNLLSITLKRWNVSTLRLILMGRKVDLIPTISDRHERETLLVATAGPLHKEGRFGGTASADEGDMLEYVLEPYAQFANAKLKSITGNSLERAVNCSGQSECADFVLKRLGYVIDPASPKEIFWVQKPKTHSDPSDELNQRVVRKALAMLGVLAEQNLVITSWRSFPADPRSLDSTTHIDYTDAVDTGSKYFKPVLPKAKWEAIAQAYNIHAHPVGGSWDKVDGVMVPWEIHAGIKYLEQSGYQYNLETQKWIAAASTPTAPETINE